MSTGFDHPPFLSSPTATAFRSFSGPGLAAELPPLAPPAADAMPPVLFPLFLLLLCLPPVAVCQVGLFSPLSDDADPGVGGTGSRSSLLVDIDATTAAAKFGAEADFGVALCSVGEGVGRAGSFFAG